MIEIIFGITLIAITVFYFKVKYKMTYWKRHGVAEEPGFFPFGSKSTWDTLSKKKALNEVTDEPYKNHPNQKLVGAYGIFGSPYIIVRDPDLIKQILVKDFDNFSERHPPGAALGGPNSKNNKYFAKLVNRLQGKEWKKVRSTLTPIFTSGKLKAMVPLIHKVADACCLHLDIHRGKEIEGKDLMRKFALDVIVSTGFGFECNSFEDPNNAFKQNADLLMGQKMDFRTLVIFFFLIISPKMLRWLDIPIFNKKATEFFVNIVLQSIKERKENGIRRNDLIDLVNETLSKDQTLPNVEGEPEKIRFTNEEIEGILVSNSLILFIAGFDTVSSTAGVAVYYLAKNQNVQEKLYQEVSNEVQEHGSKNLGYAEIMKLKYLDMVFLESQRSYPLTPLTRCCKKDYKVPGMDLVIPKDMMVRIPMLELMRDKKYYQNPTEFYPEHYTEENKANRNPYVTGGFGHGPRNCIALRFATLEVKLAILRMVLDYKILPCEKTVEKLIPDPKSRTFQPKGGLWFTVEKRT